MCTNNYLHVIIFGLFTSNFIPILELNLKTGQLVITHFFPFNLMTFYFHEKNLFHPYFYQLQVLSKPSILSANTTLLTEDTAVKPEHETHSVLQFKRCGNENFFFQTSILIYNTYCGSLPTGMWTLSDEFLTKGSWNSVK